MARPTLGTALRAAGLCALLATATVSAAVDAPVADAAARGDAAAVEALLTKGADVNSPQGDGMTALHWAAMNDEPTLAAVLLQAGANPRAATRVGAYTPLLLAAKLGHRGVVEALLKGGADPATKTDNGTTALMFAAASGDLESVDLLLARKPDVNARESTRGLTAAMFAAAANRATVVALLGRNGADLSATSTPLDLRVLDRSRFAGVLFGNPSPPKTPGGEAGSVEGGGRNGMNRPATQTRVAGWIATSPATNWSTPRAA